MIKMCIFLLFCVVVFFLSSLHCFALRVSYSPLASTFVRRFAEKNGPKKNVCARENIVIYIYTKWNIMNRFFGTVHCNMPLPMHSERESFEGERTKKKKGKKKKKTKCN